MSVLMTMRIAGDAKAIEAQPRERTDVIVQRAREHGLIAHRFWGNDRAILVVDEWPDEGSFQKFWDASPDIGEMMKDAGVTEEPTVEFWRPLNVGDEVG
jgi:hypothetical protein